MTVLDIFTELARLVLFFLAYLAGLIVLVIFVTWLASKTLQYMENSESQNNGVEAYEIFTGQRNQPESR